MPCNFGIDHYREILEIATEHGYRFIGFDAPTSPPGERVCILRHDIDYMPEWSLGFGRIERDLGIRATYFFQVSARTYNIRETSNHRVIRTLAEWGHTLGLHIDLAWDTEMEWEEVAEFGQKEKDIFRLQTGIEPCEIISFHNPHRFKDRVLDRSVPGLRHTYEPAFFSDIKYLSDSQGWYEGCMCGVFAARKYDAIHLLTPPYIWPEETTGESIGDIARMIKGRTDELVEYLVTYHPVCARNESRLRETLTKLR